jgi:hypothetical protein
MIDSREYPPEELENDCKYCGEPCENQFCDRDCRKGYHYDNFVD